MSTTYKCLTDRVSNFCCCEFLFGKSHKSVELSSAFETMCNIFRSYFDHNECRLVQLIYKEKCTIGFPCCLMNKASSFIMLKPDYTAMPRIRIID